MKKIFLLLFLVPVALFAQQDSVLSGSYAWKEPLPAKNKISTAVLLQGIVYDFKWMQVSANVIKNTGTKPATYFAFQFE